MNKVLIVILVLGAGALLYYFLSGNTNLIPGVEVDENVDMELVEEGLKENRKKNCLRKLQ
jgi:ABC-type lipoprotein export system ATPase subunit